MTILLSSGYRKFAEAMKKYTYKKAPPAYDLELTATEIDEKRALPAPEESEKS